jgi:choline kinase
MRAVIIAAGTGSRLGEYSKDKPKTLVEISGTPILGYTLDNLIREGIKDIVIITGYMGHKIKEFVNKKYSSLNVSYVHNEIYDKTNNIYSIYLARDKLVNSDFLLINSDVLFHGGILQALRRSEKEGVILSVDFSVKLGEEEMKVKVEGDAIVEISKKIPPKEADGEYIGLTRVDRSFSEIFFESLEKTMKEKGTGVFYEEAFQTMIDDGIKLRYESTQNLPWIEIDTPEDLKIAQEVIAPRIQQTYTE